MKRQPEHWYCVVAFLIVSTVCLSGCGESAAEKRTASRRKTTADKTSAGKATAYAPAIAKQVSAEPPARESSPAAATPDAAQPAEPAAGGGEAPSDRLASVDAAKPQAGGALAGKGPAGKAAAAEPPPKGGPADMGQVDPLDLIMPPVLLTQRLAETCRVKVGDTLPDVRLPKLDGSETTLKDLFGERLTVVVFWKATQPYAVEELGDLQYLVADRFAQQRVNVVGIDVQDQPQVARETVTAEKVSFPNLLDADGAAFAQVASSRVPRTYLVDGSGKILWFDMEYSRSTRRDLMRAIRATLSVVE